MGELEIRAFVPPYASRSPVRLLVGLGNPGPEYATTRHNAGCMVLERMAARQALLFRSSRALDADARLKGFTWGRLSEPDALLVMPQTFMNLSGQPLVPLVRWCVQQDSDFDPRSVLVVYDDMDLELGRLRLRPKGGHGGHNGMRSLLDCLATDEFPRLRIGIGRGSTDAARHVLDPFTTEERPVLDEALDEAAAAALDWLTTGDIESCMTRFHSRWSQGT